MTSIAEIEAVLPRGTEQVSERVEQAVESFRRAGRAESRARHAMDFLDPTTPEFILRAKGWQDAVQAQAKAADELVAAELSEQQAGATDQ